MTFTFSRSRWVFCSSCISACLRVGISEQTPVLGNSVRRASIKAAVLKEFGKPLVVKEISSPKKLGATDVRIGVQTCGVNFSDVLICQGDYGQRPKLPFIPGFEISGEIIDIGSEVKNFKPGDRVVGLNKQKNTGLAEQSVASATDVWKIPSSMSYEAASGLVENYATAYLGLSRRAVIEPEDIVIVTAAAGGLGLAALDIAANVFKAKVIAITDTEAKADIAREKGAWAALRYKKKDVLSKVKDISEGEGAKIIFDGIGGDVFKDMLECVAHEGKVIVAGFASRVIPSIPTSLLLPQSCSIIGISLTHYREAAPDVYRDTVEEVIKMAEDKYIEPQISATFTLEEVNKAFEFLLERKSTGNVIVKIKS